MSIKGNNTDMNQYLDYSVDSSFQRVNMVFVLSFQNGALRIVQTEYFLQTIKIEDYNDMINGRKFLDQAVKNDAKTWSYSKNCKWPERWSHNWLFTRSSFIQKILQDNCNRIK